LGVIFSRPAGDDLEEQFTGLAAFLLWGLLALGLLLASIRGWIPIWSTVVACVLLPWTWFSVTAILQLFHANFPVRWMTIVPVMVPPLVAAYLVWAVTPRVHGLLSPNAASAALWALVFVLAVIPWPKTIAEQERKEQEAADRKARKAAQLARFNQVSTDWKVRDCLQFLDPRPYPKYHNPSEMHKNAIQKISRLKGRQAEIEHMMDIGDFILFDSIDQLDLTPSPALCKGARKWLKKQAVALKPSAKRTSYEDIGEVVGHSQYPLQWFARNGCPMLDELKEFEATVFSYPEANVSNKALYDDLLEIERSLEK
jgi:hypothetical protein